MEYYEKIRAWFAKMEDATTLETVSKPTCILWTRKGIGFGTATFYFKDGKLKLDTESMGPEFVKKLLCDLVDEAEITG